MPYYGAHGIRQIIHTFGSSFAGPRAAFRPAPILSIVLAPWRVDSGVESVLLLGCLAVVLIVALLSSGGVEATIARDDAQRCPLTKCAKDLGLGAVPFSMVNVLAVPSLVPIAPST